MFFTNQRTSVNEIQFVKYFHKLQTDMNAKLMINTGKRFGFIYAISDIYWRNYVEILTKPVI